MGGCFSSRRKDKACFSHLRVCVGSLEEWRLFNSNLDVVDDAGESAFQQFVLFTADEPEIPAGAISQSSTFPRLATLALRHQSEGSFGVPRTLEGRLQPGNLYPLTARDAGRSRQPN